MSGLSEREELELLELENENAGGMKDAPASDSQSYGRLHAEMGIPPPANFGKDTIRENVARGAFLQPPTENATPLGRGANALARDLPPAIAGDIARPFGLPLGIPGEMGASALGAGAVRGLQHGVSAIIGGGEAPSTVAKDMATTAATQGTISGVMGLGAKYAKPVVKFGSQYLRNMAGIPESSGAAALGTDVLSQVPTKADVNGAYGAFESATGTASPRLMRELAGETQSGAQSTKAIEAAKELLAPYINYDASRNAGSIVYDKVRLAADVASGKVPRQYLTQVLYEASQGSNFLGKLAKAGSPEQIANQASNSLFGSTADDMIEMLNPGSGYGTARAKAFAQKVGEQFSSFFPLNRNMSPNQLRGFGSMATAAGGAGMAAYTGDPKYLAALAAPFATSPLMYGMAIRGAKAASPAMGPGLRIAAESIASRFLPAGTYPIAQEYQRLRP